MRINNLMLGLCLAGLFAGCASKARQSSGTTDTRGELSFAFLPSDARGSSAGDLNLNSEERMLYRRAVEAIGWSMPLINFQAMRDGLKQDAGGNMNDVA